MIHGIGDVRRRRNQVGGEDRRPAARLDHHHLVMLVWPPVRATRTPGMISAVVVDERRGRRRPRSGTKFSGR